MGIRAQLSRLAVSTLSEVEAAAVGGDLAILMGREVESQSASGAVSGGW